MQFLIWLKVYNLNKIILFTFIMAIFGTIFHGMILQQMGVIVLYPPVVLPLILAVVAGTFTGKYVQSDLLPLPNPSKIIIARMIWLVVINALFLFSLLFPLIIIKQNLSSFSILRNLLVSSSISVVFAITDKFKDVYWFPASAWLLITMLFGNGDTLEHPLFDFVLNSGHKPFEMHLAFVLFLISIIFYVVKGNYKHIKP